jgi:hypothetical protein
MHISDTRNSTREYKDYSFHCNESLILPATGLFKHPFIYISAQSLRNSIDIMKFAFATVALLFSSALASPVGNTTDGGLVKRKSAKRGAAFNSGAAINPMSGAYVACDADFRVPFLRTSSCSVSWAYDWSPSPIGSIPSGVKFIPMIWVSTFLSFLVLGRALICTHHRAPMPTTSATIKQA